MQITHTPQEQDMHTNTADAQMRTEFIELLEDVAPVVHTYRNINVNAGDVQAFLELLERTASQVRDMQHQVITRNIDRHLAEQAAAKVDPLAPPVGDLLLSNYGDLELHFRRSDGCYVITHPSHDTAVYEPDALDEACNSFASRAGCDPVVVLNEAVRLTEGA
jgi:hypothetical protein